MATKRKLRRAQERAQRRGGAELPKTRSVDKADLRRQSSAERFARPGSEKLWLAMLGWDEARRSRIWLVDAVHDGSIWKERAADGGDVPPYDPAGVAAALANRMPEVAGRLEPSAIDAAVDAWLDSGDEFDPSSPPAKWEALAKLCASVDLGEVAPGDLQDDWETWIGPALASRSRVDLMDALKTAEQLSTSLHQITKSPNVFASTTLLRLVWTALAYGDERTFERIRGWSDEALAELSRAGGAGSLDES